MTTQASSSNILLVDGSTFHGNQAYEGGAVRSRDFLSLSNSTFNGNGATDAAGGSALRLAGTALITNVTVVGNSAPGNGAVRISSASGTYVFKNVVVASNSGGDCSSAGGILSGGFNIETDSSCGTAFTDVANAVVGVLGDYGGPTWTMPLLPGSPALNAGDQFSCMAKDQRGVTRPQGVNCDIGAFESHGFIIAMDGGDNQSTAINTYFAQPLVASVTGSTWEGKQEPVNGGIVDFAAPISTTASISEGPEVTVTIDSGLATLWAVANSLRGSYQVTGTAGGATGSAIFHLENTLFPSEVRVSSSANPVVDKQQPFSLTVEVMMQSPPPSLSIAGLAVPTGTVHIVDTTGAISLTGELIEPFRVSQICLADAVQTGGCGLSASYVVFEAPVLPAGTYTLTATYDGNYRYDPSTSAPFYQVVLQSPVAVNDAAGALQNTPVTIPVLANDIAPTGDAPVVIANGLIVSAVGSATHGVAVIDPGAQTVTYTPAPGFSGLDTFTYTARASNTGTDDALVAVVVAPLSEADVPEQVSVTNPEVAAAHFFTSAVAGVRVDLPAGFFTGTLGEKDVLFLSYTPIFTPTANTGVLPGQLKFGHFEFDLTMHLNDQVLVGYQFPTPYTLTITYDGGIMSNLNEETLVLYIWDGAAWVGTGINLVTHDTTNHVLVVTVDTTGQFAFFAESPTDIDPEPEPDWANHLFMPGLYDQDQPAGEAAAPVEQVQPIEPVLSPFEMVTQIFLPAMNR
ncbi:MAG: Ig-like domain repeat protein [Anaerolineales bacterium]|nr:Ig-like domain repeat protein [Anaerolineales bacterium]